MNYDFCFLFSVSFAVNVEGLPGFSLKIQTCSLLFGPLLDIYMKREVPCCCSQLYLKLRMDSSLESKLLHRVPGYRAHNLTQKPQWRHNTVDWTWLAAYLGT